MEASPNPAGETSAEFDADKIAAEFFFKYKDKIDFSLFAQNENQSEKLQAEEPAIETEPELECAINAIINHNNDDKNTIEKDAEENPMSTMLKPVRSHDLLISDCIKVLMTSGKLITRGIFVTSGDKMNIKALITQYDPTSCTVTEPVWDMCTAHDIAETLLLRLKSLSPALISLETFNSCMELYVNDGFETDQEICDFVKGACAEENKPLLNTLINFLQVVVHFAEFNGCESEVLAEAFCAAMIEQDPENNHSQPLEKENDKQESGLDTSNVDNLRDERLEPEIPRELSLLIENAKTTLAQDDDVNSVLETENEYGNDSEFVDDTRNNEVEKVAFDVILVQTLIENFSRFTS
uniref:Rho-GAP domain-containing protein n=1 Tax=Aplanochytrium stocchinoi TaxID=215587 RepID=A0A7S3UZM7_9STRA|mmetsp:Transcript_5558/g.6527  ORF Transcript_5558/g.6527 Transcript_5558/m.6527 type:complete len:353 (-) Transcript_5558:90-1148(-)|eukprot:CAMPEP_0204823966 /NCGR_PEP_ID=MMETSP1346-20131115/2036_1 /ASSEMBLY_ACC=CAM_ASM_000771 /TAXON_ID=215587 /ORGANISM="Aplanochytrium stocchinoi, Strain GSBS06" /LENGTH=352 /DNA_ID=CAMNT_0051950873 /DNA_START=425 /DNA_END=1483 /DNA_ORIENTATION=-